MAQNSFVRSRSSSIATTRLSNPPELHVGEIVLSDFAWSREPKTADVLKGKHPAPDPASEPKVERDSNKDKGLRPCVIVWRSKDGSRLALAPISHSEHTMDATGETVNYQPQGAHSKSRGVEIPRDLKNDAGLTNNRGWACVDQINVTSYPSTNISLKTDGVGSKPRTLGHLPDAFIKEIGDGNQKASDDGVLRMVAISNTNKVSAHAPERKRLAAAEKTSMEQKRRDRIDRAKEAAHRMAGRPVATGVLSPEDIARRAEASQAPRHTYGQESGKTTKPSLRAPGASPNAAFTATGSRPDTSRGFSSRTR